MSGISAQSLDADGNPTQITKKDRKALQKSLRRLIPGARVLKNGQISVPGGTNSSAASRLITGIANTGRSVTILVNNSGENSTQTRSEFILRKQGHPLYVDMGTRAFGRPADAVVMWDPNKIETSEERESSGAIRAAPTDPAVTLAHELIHAFNYMRSNDQAYANLGGLFGNPSIDHKHYFTEGGVAYFESGSYDELRTVGFYGNQIGDVTENQIRAQLGIPSRATYDARKFWQLAPSN
jgi:hypothetical protein